MFQRRLLSMLPHVPVLGGPRLSNLHNRYLQIVSAIAPQNTQKTEEAQIATSVCGGDGMGSI